VCAFGADGDDGDGDDGDGDGVGDGDHSTSTFASKLPQTWSLLLAQASTDLEHSSSQSFHRLRAF
jgi:hypothetical protein